MDKHLSESPKLHEITLVFKLLLAVILTVITISAICERQGQFFDTIEQCDKSNTSQSQITGLSESGTLIQQFVAPAERVNKIGVLFATYCDTLNRGQIHFKLCDMSNHVLYETSVPVTELQDNSYYDFPVYAKLEKGATYQYILSASGCSPDPSPVVWVGDFGGRTGAMTFNGEVRKDAVISRFEIGQYNNMPIKNAILLALVLILLLVPVQAGKKVSLVLNIAGLLIYPFLAMLTVESMFQNPFDMAGKTLFYNYLLYLMVYLVLFSIVGRYRLTILLGSILTLVAGLANSYVLEFRGTPVCPWDIMSLRTAADVAGEYDFGFSQEVLHSVLWLAAACVLLFFIKERKEKWLPRLISAAGILAYTVGILVLFVGTNHLENQGFSVDLWSQRKGYISNGYFLSFAMNTKYMKVDTPKGYKADKAEEILQNYEEMQSQQKVAKQPNIIMIMNEAYTDLSVVGDFETTADYMPFVNNLQENTVKGNLYVSIFGGGTCNSEYEVLTGNSMAFLAPGSIAYQQYVSSSYATGGLTETLKSQGYACYAIHPMDDANWNRINVYDSMGFDEFKDITAFKSPQLIRQTYISDWDTYKMAIDFFENKPANQPIFVMDVTVQNHGGYESGVTFEEPVAVQGMNSAYPKTNEFLSLMKMSDHDFKKLVQYFEQVEEPTMIVMFGDHHPALDDEFYEELYGKSLEELNLEEMQKRYQVPFIIWTNYDIEEKEVPAMSANYLAGQVLEYAGLKIPKYFVFQNEMMKLLPVININGYMDASGNSFTPEDENPYKDWIEQYKILHYNSAIDIRHTWHPMYTCDN